MKASKRMKMLGFFGLVVAVSVANNLILNDPLGKEPDGF